MLSSKTREWLLDRALKFKTRGNSDFAAARDAFAAKGLHYPDSIMDKSVREIVADMRAKRKLAS